MSHQTAQSALAPFAAHMTRAPETVAADLESYALLLKKWQRVQNLVSRETLDALWSRHFADSLQILPLIGDADRHILDLGSGGGLPAIPLAIATRGSGRRLTLIESNGRKVSFLRAVSRELQLPIRVIGGRIEAADPAEIGEVNVFTSRALAPLPLLLQLIAPFWGPQSRALLHKGREHVEELKQTDAQWRMDVIVKSSVTEPSGAILEISGLRRRSE